MTFDKIQELVDELRNGRMVILVDDEDRENEGDLVIAASLVRPEDVNFMARYARGSICLTLTRARCEQLNLSLMVGENADLHSTKFTVSIEAAHGVTTGISAGDRAKTVLAAVAPDAVPADLVQPGHVFPVSAEPGGVLTRAGHTEAGCDLAGMAGFEPAAVIAEILNEDGTMARRPDLELFAAEHGLKIGSIADLIQYRMLHEKTVERLGECRLPTQFGEFKLAGYLDTLDDVMHLALVMGEIEAESPVLIRVHVQDSLHDLTRSRRPDSGWPLSDAMERVAKQGAGVIIILRNPERTADLVREFRKLEARDRGEEVAGQEMAENLRTYGVGAQILLDLGVKRMRVMSAPKRLLGISGFGLEVVEYVEG